MKKNMLLLASVLAASVTLTSCGNSNSTEKDFSVGFAKGVKISPTGLKTVNSGLKLTDSYLTADGARMASNQVEIGKKIAVVFEGIDGFKATDGKVFPSLGIIVMDNANNVVLHYDDLLKSETGYSEKDASVLSGSVVIGDPLKKGQSYKVVVSIADKKGEGSIASTVDLKVN
ncbi:hypothetical protein [Pedobacter foliorum]|uniref:hypothetical protein n=1 Tax=Pedobacter foliorum TaxID=2739058 RepID=UPI001565C4CC|nr:hypothetical protein [Pedobacter foliorum]NRF37419.1 hypothetical protein [Pedobacter foliorum]